MPHAVVTGTHLTWQLEQERKKERNCR